MRADGHEDQCGVLRTESDQHAAPALTIGIKIAWAPRGDEICDTLGERPACRRCRM